MKKPGFIEGVVVAVIICVTTSIGYSIISVFYSATDTWRILIAVISFGYSIYLLGRSRQLSGRIIVLAIWLLMSIALWLFKPPIIDYALIHLAAIWLIRSFYFHARIVYTLLDLGLITLSAAMGFWAFLHSGSLLLSLWCLFLVQALFVAIPGSIKTAPADQSSTNSNVKFQQVLRTAQSALNNLSRS